MFEQSIIFLVKLVQFEEPHLSERPNPMTLLERISQAFTMAFGITQPSGRQRRTAALFVVGLILLILAFFAGLAFFLIHHFLG